MEDHPMKSIKIGGAFLMTVVLGGCGADVQPTSDSISGQSSASVTPRQPLPTSSGSFPGHYVVPVPANLAAAARYSVDRVDWSVDHGIATLRYYLPIGLVGGSLEVEFSGSLRPGATSVVLRSPGGGTATCTALETIVTCHEIFGDLGELPISMKVVRAYAAQEYAGPVEDRVAVANVFSSDPIGFVDFDVAP
jgi:hypothetical protein